MRVSRLIQNVSFTSHFTERQHASAATLKRFHPDYDVTLLTARSFLHTFRSAVWPPPPKSPLTHQPCNDIRLISRDSVAQADFSVTILQKSHPLPPASPTRSVFAKKPVQEGTAQSPPGKCTPEEKIIAQSQERLRRLRAKRPGMIAGRRAYFADMMLKAKYVAQAQGKDVALARQKVLHLHSKNYDNLPPLEKRACEMKAQGMREERREHVASQIAQEEALIEEKVAMSSTLVEHKSMLVSQSRLTETQLEQASKLRQAAVFPPKTVRKFRKEALRCPPPLSEEAFNSLTSQRLLADSEGPNYSGLGRQICHHRNIFGESIIGIKAADGGMEWFRHVFSMQQPCRSSWLPLRPVSLSTPVVAGMSGRLAARTAL